MQINRILLLLITVILAVILFSSAFSSTISPGSLEITVNNDTTAPVSFQNQTQFTVLLSPEPDSLAILNEKIQKYTGTISSDSGLLNFRVADRYFNSVNEALSELKGGVVSDYFSVNESQPVLTDLLYSNVTPYQIAPFAYTPSLIASAYNFTQAYANNDYGQGITIGIVDAYGDPNIQYDLNAFDHMNDLPPINLSIYYPSGKPLSVSRQWAIETSTDVEWAHAMAPQASIKLFVVPNDGLTALMNATSMVISHNLANVISLSWGVPESSISSAEIATYSEMIQQAQFRGISVVAASGDQGALDGTTTPTVNFPASDPYILSVGGTSLSFLNKNAVIQEGWGGNISGKTYGSGGGFSKYFSKPSYQDGIKNITNMRGVPDVAMDADNYTGVQVITGGGQYRIGGTSIGTPIWSAVIALMDSADNTTIGSPDPLFYQIYHSNYYNMSFTQVYYGSNGYYSNSAGWNPVTGLGTPNVWQLILSSEKFLAPYGARLQFNPSSYNFSGLESSLSLSGRLSDSIMANSSFTNSSDLFYVSLYADKEQFIESGILIHNDTYRSILYLRNYGLNKTEYGPVLSIPEPMVFSLSLNENGTLISSSSGGTNLAMAAFLNFSGMALPNVGESILGGKDNSSFIYNGTFSNTYAILGNRSISLEPEYLQRYSSVESGFSNISVSGSNGNYTFYRGLSRAYSPSTSKTQPLILFNESFSYPSIVSLSLTTNNSNIKWLVNGTALNSGRNYFDSTGGSYAVEAAYPANDTAIAYREITVPRLRESELNVSSTVSYLPAVAYSAVIDNGIIYSGKTGTDQKIVLTNGTDSISLSSKGFNTTGMTVNAAPYLNLSLEPMKVNFEFFVFQPNSTVTVDGTSLEGVNGTYGPYQDYIKRPVSVTVSSKGFNNYSISLNPEPGTNYRETVVLEPLNSSLIKVSGYLIDNVFGFDISGGRIYSGNDLLAYANSTGYFVFYSSPGDLSINVTSPLYEKYSGMTDITSSMSPMKIYLTPLDISISSRVILSLGRYFPFLFYFSYISWTRYTGSDFSHYEIYISGNPQFSNSRGITLGKQSSSYTFLTGITPFHTTYVILELYLNNSQQYTTQSVKISYSNPYFVAANIAITGGLVFYVALMIDYLYLKRKRNRMEE
jgi:subtilase family serine protease